MKKLNKTIGLIGCGNMGSAILMGLLRNQISRGSQIFVYDSIRSKMKSLSRICRANTAQSNRDLVRQAQVILLAVKPQDIEPVAREVQAYLRSSQTVISILAGTPIQKIRRIFGNRAAIVRAMPNLGAQVGEAVTVVTSSSRLALTCAETIFSGCGKVVRLSEKYFDLVTAVSGSGPAYFFLIMELLARAARSGGLSEKAARLLVVQTAVGAAKLAQGSPYLPGELRKMVTSKKGTTEAAIKFLFQKQFPKIFSTAIDRAIRRACELSKS